MFSVGRLAATQAGDDDLAARVAATQNIGPFFGQQYTAYVDGSRVWGIEPWSPNLRRPAGQGAVPTGRAPVTRFLYTGGAGI